MNKHARIYVAGHRGLVGSALVRSLQKQGFENLIVRTHAELDLADQLGVKALFEKERPDYVFLAAAKVGGIHANNAYPAEFIRSNLSIQDTVIHESWRCGVKRLLFLGSSCIYPRDCPQPIREEYLLTGPLEKTNRSYAIAKIAGIEMCSAYNRQYGTRFLAVMPTNLYGPADHYDLENSHVLPALIRKFHLGKLAMQGQRAAIERDEAIHGLIPDPLRTRFLEACDSKLSPDIVIWGTGRARREFLYSDDMADACVFLMGLPEEKFSVLLDPGASHPGSGLSFPMINIGCGEDLSIAELAHLVGEVVGFEGKIIQDTSKPDGTPRKLMDVTRLNGMGWKANTSLREGIALAYRDYLARH